LSLEWKATVPIGDVSRGGRTRGDHQACEPDWGLQEQDLPWGIVAEDRGQLHSTFGSSYTTSDVIVDARAAWWAALDETAQVAMARLQINMDNGPESRGRRPQFWQRMVACCAALGKPIQRLYDPPSHSQYHPIERCWGMLEWHWNGTKLVEVETRVEWAKSMPWQGRHPIVALSRKVSQKGITLSTRAMRAVEDRLERHPEFPQWDILIRPVSP
jgi:hypothetical protein